MPRGLRKCPAGFQVSAVLVQWAAGPDGAPLLDEAALRRETAKLRDYTFPRAISDWDGAWRNWMRRANDDTAARLGRAHTGHPQETAGHRQAREAVETLTGGRASAKRPGSDGPPPGHPATLPFIDEEPRHVAPRPATRLLR